jgi:hypothetical protein
MALLWAGRPLPEIGRCKVGTSQDVLSCALCAGVEPGTGHLVRQWTLYPTALLLSVGLLLVMTGSLESRFLFWDWLPVQQGGLN